MTLAINEIRIRFIPQSEQRYDTCGDWFSKDGTLHIFASEMQDARYQHLVAVHELVEALACNVDGVSQEAVDAFDMGAGAVIEEPGNDPAAPYHKQHMAATAIERLLAEALGVDWTAYDAAVGDHGVRE
jgi:hypothetical protein